MASARLYQSETSQRRTVLFRHGRPSAEGLISELQRTASSLEATLQGELAGSVTKDPNAATFPMLARSLMARLDNVRSTIAALEASRVPVEA